jgi:hypothetical protein
MGFGTVKSGHGNVIERSELSPWAFDCSIQRMTADDDQNVNNPGAGLAVVERGNAAYPTNIGRPRKI